MYSLLERNENRGPVGRIATPHTDILSKGNHLRSVTRLLSLVAVWFFGIANVEAQTGLQIPLQFDFLNPGARSLAMGSAFAGLADDATAAFTNPAGLTVLRSVEASIEFRSRRLETRFLAGGRLSGQPSGRGIDTIAGPLYSDPVSSSNSVGFLSFVYPRDRWAITGYRHQLLDVEFDLEGQGAFQRFGSTGDVVLDTARQPPILANRSIRIANYGVSGAVELGTKVSIGAGLSFYTFTFDTLLRRFALQPAPQGQTAVFNGADFSDEIVRRRRSVMIADLVRRSASRRRCIRC